MNERMAIGAGGGGGMGGGDRTIARLVQMAQHYGLANDRVARQKIAGYYVHSRAASLTNQRALGKIKAGQTPGPELSIAKLAGTNNGQRLGQLVSDLLGPRLVADGGEWGTYAWSEMILGLPGGRVAGGTDEVMRNILGERVLGLPKDPSHQR